MIIERGETIHNILVIAEKQKIGACLVALLRGEGYSVKIVESYGKSSDVFQDFMWIKFDLVIATNTLPPPAHIQSIVLEMKARHPHARIIALSGYYPEGFVSDLKQKGIDGFVPLPFDEDVLLREVAGLLSSTSSQPEGVSSPQRD